MDVDEASQAPAATTSAASELATAAAAASASDDCLVASRAGFALVPCGHARFCKACTMRGSDMVAARPVCRADITMVMRIFSQMTDYAKLRWRRLAKLFGHIFAAM